jgi:methionyl-tRNA formyltransferase
MSSIIFMGTPEFAVPTLRALHNTFTVKAVVTVPDKPQGRGQKVSSSAIKQAAQELGITTILQPVSLRDELFYQELHALQPDIFCVVAFRILPKSIYTLARLGAFNIHGSLLPKYRGAAPINWAIIRGETETGVTSFLLADQVDTGVMIDRKTLSIHDQMTAGELHDAMMPLAAQLAVETTQAMLSGAIYTQQQDDILATNAPKIFREMCEINWLDNANAIKNFIHGLSPYPGAWSMLDGKPCKILRVVLDTNNHLKAGEYLRSDSALYVGCGMHTLRILALQPEGKRAMPTEDFLRGWRSNHSGFFVHSV